MRTKKFKQLACISEDTASAFEAKTNAVLSQTPNPEIILDKTQPFTAYVFYNVSKSEPETFLELLEMISTTGCARCQDCRHFEPDRDRRKVRGQCTKDNKEVRKDCHACEVYYLEQRKVSADIIEEYKRIPFLIDR